LILVLDIGLLGSYAEKTMEVRLTPDQEAFVRQAIEAGRFGRAEDAVAEALLLWEERERKRTEFLATLDDAKASIARGEGHVISQQSMRDLATGVKQRGRVRLDADHSTPR
jgi:putative addiction module CopG family antidote